MANGPELLKEWRESKGLTQTEAAERFGTCMLMVWRYENGKCKPPLLRAKDIAARTRNAVPVDSWE